jgi:pimeloyl-ACP methyl ester carboxylesterase
MLVRSQHHVGARSMSTRIGLSLAFTLCAAFSSPSVAQVASARAASGIAGHWEGFLVREGARLPVSFDFSVQPHRIHGTFTSLTQRTMEYPLDTVVVEGERVHFELGGGSLVFDGRSSGDSITGKLSDEGAPATFALRRTQRPPLPYVRHDVTFQNGDVVLSGSLFIPPAARRHSAVIFVHGSGPETRWGTSRFFADRLARRGVAAFIYDKRGAGASKGDWRRATFEDLADDAIAAIRVLEKRSDIDSKRIGIFGHSQGGLIAPLAAARAPRAVAFLIAAATYPDSVWQQDVFRVEKSIRRQKFSDVEVSRAMDVYRLFLDVARGVKPWEELESASAPVREERWYKFLGIPPREHWLWAYYRGTGNFVALNSWQKIRVPVLLVYGERDQLVPVAESIGKIESALEMAGNREYASMLLPRAAHNLTVTPESGQPFGWWSVAPGFPELLTAWVMQASQVQPSRAR